MIKMYVMHTCPDCEYVEKQVVGNPNFEVIDIGKHVRNLKQFIKLRDTNPAFDEAKAVDDLGIPCYVLEDGTVTLIRRMLDWSQGHRRRVRLAVSTEEGAEQIRHQKPRSRAVETKSRKVAE
jgi:glutaredoxin-related protein